MLTHRHKKPFECKADGCGKSYCDARSLRRHTENHHVHPSLPISTPTISVQEVISNTSNIPTCIHYAPKGTQSFHKNHSSSAKLPKTTVSVEKSIVLKASNQVQSKQTASSGDASVSEFILFSVYIIAQLQQDTHYYRIPN
ncbi:hypothetical protein V9T40_014719 [Parthenolecanium corni]|uniref:C2H2-type domain-containing protein n=1 Tax=Parthenolecanium corni TaxID=536013 RepID=A0AAN9XX14_9HEMI